MLVDYDGAHDYNNMELLALRMAPVQCSWIGDLSLSLSLCLCLSLSLSLSLSL